MAKVRINGEFYEFDFSRQPLAEMLALEAALKTSYGQWVNDRQAGTARALAGLIWLVWRRNGRDVDFADIESGEIPVDLADFDIEDDEAPDPTTAPSTRGASPGTGGSTSARSRKSSASAPGK